MAPLPLASLVPGIDAELAQLIAQLASDEPDVIEVGHALLAAELRPLERLPQILHARENRRQLFEREVRLGGEQAQRRLAVAGRHLPRTP